MNIFKHFSLRHENIQPLSTQQNKKNEQKNVLKDSQLIQFLNASLSGQLDIIENLWKKNQSLINEYLEEDKKTSLHLSCSQGHFKIVQFLISNGADYNFLVNNIFMLMISLFFFRIKMVVLRYIMLFHPIMKN